MLHLYVSLFASSLTIAPAHAAPVEAWNYSAFQGGSDLAGVDGWTTGYERDPWRGYYDGTTRWAYPTTDDSGGTWGSGEALDGWLVHEAVEVRDGFFQAMFTSDDDDAVGIVIGHANSGNFYLFSLCGVADGDDPDCPLGLSSGPGSAIVKIEAGRQTILAETSATMARNARGTMTFGINDGELVATYDDITLTATDSAFRTVNSVGFWSYNAGQEQGERNPSYVKFGDPAVYAYDDDGDGIVDDSDNCEFASNADQADGNANGIGDACDENIDTGDADTDTDADTDADTDSDTDTDTAGGDTGTTDRPGSRKNADGGLGVDGSCACDSGASGLAGLIPMLLAATAARKRSGGRTRRGEGRAS